MTLRAEKEAWRQYKRDQQEAYEQEFPVESELEPEAVEEHRRRHHRQRRAYDEDYFPFSDDESASDIGFSSGEEELERVEEGDSEEEFYEHHRTP